MLIAFLFLIYLKCHCPSIINYWLIDQTSSSLRSTMACSVQVRAVPQRGGGAGWDGLRRLRLDQPRLRPLRRQHHLRARRRRHALLHLQHPAPLPQRHHARQGHHRPLLRLGRRRGARTPALPGAAPSPPADEQQHRSNSASSPAAGPSSSAASAPRHWQQQPAMAVAGLALAALVAMAA